MNAPAVMHSPNTFVAPVTPRITSRWLGWTAGVGAVLAVGWFTRDLPGWVIMSAVAATEWFALKFATLDGYIGRADPKRIAGYLFGWVGMNARAFFGAPPAARPTVGEWTFGVAKLTAGFAVAIWATRFAPAEWAPRLGLLGLLFVAHFGAFHLLSCAWRAVGVHAPPIMRAPIAATSLADLWGARWNLAFADGARRFIVKPLARRLGARGAGLVVFAFSGVVHETVLSWPAHGGWGGPTVYFLLQAAGIAVERSARGGRLGLGHGLRGRAWTLLVAGAPLPLLFHAPFLERVFGPFLHVVLGFFLP